MFVYMQYIYMTRLLYNMEFLLLFFTAFLVTVVQGKYYNWYDYQET